MKMKEILAAFSDSKAHWLRMATDQKVYAFIARRERKFMKEGREII